MKFRFCGDLDAPDWILAEIAVLSKISAVRVKVLSNQVIRLIKGAPLDFAKVKKLLLSKGDAGLTASDVKASVAALRFILASASKYDVSESTLTNELQQLGLPASNCNAVVKPYRDCREELRSALAAQSFKLPRVDAPIEWRVDCVLDSDTLENVRVPSVHVSIPTTAKKSPVAFEMDSASFRVLYNELKLARAAMDGLEN